METKWPHLIAIVVVHDNILIVNNALRAANQLAAVIAVHASAGDCCAYFLCVKISMHTSQSLY